MSTLLQDVRYGFRILMKRPAFAGISILTLALGIGLTATMFSIVYGALLRGLPFEEADQLMHLERNNPSRDMESMEVTIHDFEAWREQQTAFEALAGYYSGTVNVSGRERAERYDGSFVTSNLFPLLRAQPILGRTFREGEDLPGAEPVALISETLWRDRFGSDPAIVGQTLRANGVERTIVGVLGDDFDFPQEDAIWLPLGMSAAMEKRGEGRSLEVLGRLRDGVSLDQANVQMAAIAKRLALEHPETNEGVGAYVQPVMEEYIPKEPRMILYTMLGAVFFVLLIACVNVANLLLSQAALRMKEVGIRSAIGASRRRVVMQFLTEPLAMAVIGAVLGTGIAWFGVRLFNNAIADTNPPPWIDIRIDEPILLFVLGLTLFVTLVSGMLPALRATGGDMNEILKDESRGSSSFRVGKLTRGLVVFEVALSCGLLVAAGLMVKSVTQLRTIDFGFQPDAVFTARVGLPETQYPDSVKQMLFFEELYRELSSEPALQVAALADFAPALGSAGSPFVMEGVSYAEDRDLPFTHVVSVSPRYFDAVGVELAQGRDFGAQDTERSLPVAIVNQSFVRKHFPDGSAIGRRIRLGDSKNPREWRTIVGVAPDLFVDGLENEEPQGVYTPLTQNARRFVTIFARGRGDPLALTSPVRDLVAGVDADVPIYFVDTLGTRIASSMWFYEVFGTIFMIMGFVALFLAGIGLYGVMAFSVSRRTREMGVRMALGANPRDVLRLILGQGVAQLAVGLVLGLGLAALLSQSLSEILFRVDPRDPLIFGSIVIVLATVGTLASWIPARRATRVDPMVALRYE